MVDVETFLNDGNNEWLVRQFETYSFNGTFITDKFIPRPNISLVFHFKDCPLIIDELPIQLEPLFVGPIIPKVIKLKFHGTMDTFVANCKPTVFSQVFGLDLSPVAKRSVSLPSAIFSPLWKTMADMKSMEERVTYFTAFINSIQKTSYCPDAVDVLYDKIIGMGITTSLKEIMQHCGASKSTLLRKFLKRTGVSPKTLMRIVRLNYLWDKINSENALDYQSLVFDGHYFDQSHFINDFKAIIGETPSHFFKRNLDIVKMLSGKPKEGRVN